MTTDLGQLRRRTTWAHVTPRRGAFLLVLVAVISAVLWLASAATSPAAQAQDPAGPTITVVKNIRTSGSSIQDAAPPGMFAFSLDGGTSVPNGVDGTVTFDGVGPGPHVITETQLDFTLGTFGFSPDASFGTNCTFDAAGQATASPAPIDGTAECTFVNDQIVDICIRKVLSASTPANFDLSTVPVSILDSASTEIVSGQFSAQAPCDDSGLAGVLLSTTIRDSIQVVEIPMAGSAVQPITAECSPGTSGQGQFGDATLPFVQITGTEAAASQAQGPAPILCTFTNSAVRVCVSKALTANADAARTSLGLTVNELIAEFGFDLSTVADGSATPYWPPTGTPAPSDEPNCQTPPAVGSNIAESAAWYVPPGTTFTLTEQVPGGSPFGPASISCSGTESDVVLIGASAEVTAAAAGNIECSFVNDSIPVCVTKTIRSGAQAANFTAEDFSVNLTGTINGPETNPFDPLLGADCVNPSQPGPGSSGGAVRFFVAPGETFTLTESMSNAAKDAGIVAPVAISCASIPETGNLTFTTGNPATASVQATAPPAGGAVNCSFLNDSVAVCVTKFLTDTAELVTTPTASRFAVTVNGVALLDQLAPIVDNPACGSPVGDAAANFFVAPQSSVVITELDTTNGVGPVEIVCSSFLPSQETFIDTNGNLLTRSVELDLQEGQNSVACEFVNDSISVCVSKRLGRSTAGLGVAETDFAFSLNDGQPQVPGPSCGQVPAAQFFVRPGDDVTLTETQLTDSPVRPVDIVCTRPNVGTDPTIIGTPNVATGTIQFSTSVDDTAPIDCTFTNDALIVCITKALNEAAQEIADPSDFTFDLLVSAQEPIQLTPAASDPLCGQAQENNLGVVGVALPPGTEFSLSERDPGQQIGLTDAFCSAGNEFFELDETTLASRTIDAISAPLSQTRIDCFFRNESVLVCIAKQFGKTADEAGFTTPGTFDAAANGVVIASGLSTFTPEPGNPCLFEGQSIDNLISFYVPPKSMVTVTEILPSDSPLGLTRAECEWQGEGPVALESTLVGQTVSFELVERGRVDCVLTNDVMSLCITKLIGPNAAAAGLAASDFGFTVEPAVGNATATTNNCVTDAENGAGFGFVLPPDSAFTITEISPLGADAPVGLIDALCAGQINATVDLTAGTATVGAGHGADRITCEFVNETAVVCVGKSFTVTAQAAIDAGALSTADQSFALAVDGQVGATGVVAGQTAAVVCPAPDDGSATAEFRVKPGTEYTVTETIAAGAPTATVAASCNQVAAAAVSSVSFTPTLTDDEPNPYLYTCSFTNGSVGVTIEKTLITDDGRQASIGDFFFDGFDADGALRADGLQTGATFYVAPGASFSVSERAATGFTTTASCAAQSEALLQATAVAATASFSSSPGIDSSVICTFVNDDMPPIPVCAILFLDAGDSDFTLADFTFELFKDGAIVGQSSAAGDPDDKCADQDLVPLGDVFADGSTFSFTVSAQDADELLEFEPSSCSVDTAAAAQALRGPDAATFTADVGAHRVVCVARAVVPPPEPVAIARALISRVVGPIDEAPPAAPLEAPAAAPATQVVSSTIAVTGTSTTGVTLPAGLAMFAAGFLVLGLERRDRRRRRTG